MSEYDTATDTPIRSAGNHFTRKGYGNNVVTHAEPLEVPAYNSVEDYVEGLYRDGYVVIKNAIPRDKVEEVKSIMDQIDNRRGEEYSSWGYSKDGERREDVRFLQKSGGGPCAHPGLLPYTNIPLVMEIMEQVLNRHFHIVGGTCWLTGPGRHPMGLHSDWQVISLPEDIIADPRVRLPIYECFAHFYLNDMTVDKGPTVIVPGSHRSGRIPQNETSWNGQEAKAVCVGAGDVVLFTNDLWHGALPNVSDEIRYLYQIQYANKRIGTVSGKPIDVREDVFQAANEEQRRLLNVSDQLPGGYY